MIACHHYDYIEIACMYHYPVKLDLNNDKSVEGIAWNTGQTENKQECLLLKTGDLLSKVVLEDIKTLTVLIPNPHFTRVNLA